MDATPVRLPELVERIAAAALAVPGRVVAARPLLPGIAPHALAVSGVRLQVTLDVTEATEGGLIFNARRQEGIAARLRVSAALLPALGETQADAAAPALTVVRPEWWLPPNRRGHVGIRLPDGRALRMAQDQHGRVVEWFWPDDSIVEEVPEPGKPLGPLIGLMRRMAEAPELAAGPLEQALPKAAPGGIARMAQACRRLAADWGKARERLAALGGAAGHHGAVVLGGYVLGPLRVRLEQPLDARLEAAGPGADPDEVVSLAASFELPDRAGPRPSARILLSPPDVFAEGAEHAAFAAALRGAAGKVKGLREAGRARLRDPPHVVMRIRRAATPDGWDEDVFLYDGRPDGPEPLMILAEAKLEPRTSVRLRSGSLRVLATHTEVAGDMPPDDAAAWNRIAAVLGQHVAAISAWMGAAA